MEEINSYAASRVKDNSFKVFGKPGKFSYIVFGKRSSFEVEPNKKDVNVKGSGPYLYL